MKTNFLELTEILHQSLVDANLDDEQFNSIWSAINDVYSKLRITSVGKPKGELLNVSFNVGDKVIFDNKKAVVLWTSVKYLDIEIVGTNKILQGVHTSKVLPR